MCKVVIINKETDEKVYERKFTDKQKAMNLKQVIDKFTQKDKVEAVIIEKKEKKKKNGVKVS